MTSVTTIVTVAVEICNQGKAKKKKKKKDYFGRSMILTEGSICHAKPYAKPSAVL